ncbi:MAG: hypothetical protein JXM70_03240 [Pirellulales bacterium]|nr:hypothetical protein [Pirellulales bacterium]
MAIAQQSYGKDKEKLTPREKIEKALQQPTSFEFVKTPLPEVATYFGKMQGINILLDRRAFTGEGLDPETPITFSLKHPVTFRSALKWILCDLGLTYMIHDEVLIITTTAAAQKRLELKIYAVSEFTGNYTKKLEKFADIIKNCIAPESWYEVGGEGGVSHFNIKDKSVLIVWQTREVHCDIEAFLDKMRAATGLLSIAQQPYGKDKEKLTPREKFEKALQQPTSFEFIKTPLSEIANYFGKMHGINVLLDRQGFRDDYLDPEMPITFSLKHPVTFRSALKWVLRDLDLDYVIEDEVIFILSGCAAQARSETRIYAVSKLVANSGEKIEKVAEIITKCIAPESWSKVGGEGDVIPFTIKDQSVLIVTQTCDVHCDIEEFLDELRAAVK